MAFEVIHKREFNIRELATKTVTLYPTRAEVVQDINDIRLKPGSNQIIIHGLTPTTDETSIKVDGKGPATISDTMVELIPNLKKWEDTYPSDSEDEIEEVEEEDDGDNSSNSEDDSNEIKALSQELAYVENELKEAKEEKLSTTAQLAMLDNYGNNFEKYDKEQPPEVAACIATYREERQKIFKVHFHADNIINKLSKKRDQIAKKQARASKSIKLQKEKAARERAKKFQKQREARQGKLMAKLRLKDERAQFWPKKTYRVTVTLDSNLDFTPTSSRRGSTTSLTKTLTEDMSPDACDISLSISYITTSAWWSPRYDLNLNTTQNSGLLIYRAEFCNTTSETWKDAKITLSTSQTSFQGLGDPIPTMVPWHIRLNKSVGNDDGSGNVLLSSHEKIYKQQVNHNSITRTPEPRSMLFGLGSNPAPPRNLFGNTFPQQVAQQQLQQQQQAQAQGVRAASGSIFGNNNATQAFGSSRPGGLFGSAPQNDSMPAPPNPPSARDVQSDTGLVDDIPDSDLPSLEQPEASWSESGLTATYDIPGIRTIKPSHNKLRLRITSVVFREVRLSHVIVPKLRAAAFLKARIRNESSITLLRGPAGFTLDGSFLGNTQLPHCSANDTFSLGFGVDPGVNVTYAKPSLKRRQSGVFAKENSGVYTRTCTIMNTRSSRAIEATVLDQVPVSEDDRLRVDVLQPAGLVREGDMTSTGTPPLQPGSKFTEEKWGRATACIRKNGEIAWKVTLEPSRGVKLGLKYETRFPSAETVLSA